MSSIVISGDTSGAITLAAPAVSGTNTATLPAATGTVMVSGNMPAFSAYANNAVTISSGTFTKVQLNTKTFDTNNCFDSTTNYRFTPTVAGYYQINGRVDSQTSSGTISRCLASIYKNGSEYKRGSDINNASAGGIFASNVSDVVYFNGSTDYVELYAFISASTAVVNSSQALVFMSGSIVRGA